MVQAQHRQEVYQISIQQIAGYGGMYLSSQVHGEAQIGDP
jgi:hypothetical protein